MPFAPFLSLAGLPAYLWRYQRFKIYKQTSPFCRCRRLVTHGVADPGRSNCLVTSPFLYPSTIRSLQIAMRRSPVLLMRMASSFSRRSAAGAAPIFLMRYRIDRKPVICVVRGQPCTRSHWRAMNPAADLARLFCWLLYRTRSGAAVPTPAGSAAAAHTRSAGRPRSTTRWRCNTARR
jgi:hypothetical protein